MSKCGPLCCIPEELLKQMNWENMKGIWLFAPGNKINTHKSVSKGKTILHKAHPYTAPLYIKESKIFL